MEPEKKQQNPHKKRSTSRTKELFRLNLSASIIAVVVNLLLFIFLDRAKHNFTLISTYANLIILFWYLKTLLDSFKDKLNVYKREVLYISYPVNILFLLIFLASVLVVSMIYLLKVNPDAANLTFVFTFFMSTLGVMTPTIVLLVFINFIVPAFIIPTVKNSKNTLFRILLYVLFALFLLFILYSGFIRFNEVSNFDKQARFKVSRLTVKYATNYLQIANEVSPRAKQLMSRDTVTVPFLYTSDSFTYGNYDDASIFCRSLDASVPNYLEIYHIIFNRFDTFGEKYYWTSDKDGLGKEIPLVLHFKNMSYEIVRKPEGVNPELFCVAPAETDYRLGSKKYFQRNFQIERKNTIEKLSKTPVKEKDILKDLIKMENKTKQVYPPPGVDLAVNREKKHVNFSVKEVPQDVFERLLQQGYVYNSSDTIRREFEINEVALNNVVRNTTNNIKLCYYPFAEYGDLGMNAEKEIWEQSFCSPAFDITSVSPALKTKNEKDSYCMANGGRLPNIPELIGIIKTLGITKTNVQFWTNNKVHTANGEIAPVFVYFKDGRFLKVEAAPSTVNGQAYAFCVKKPKIPSIVIANYKSKFHNTDGSYYARMKCPSCKYYEVPDVILQQ